MSDISQFHGPNAAYAEELWEQFRRDPQSVDSASRDILDQWQATAAPVPENITLDVDRVVRAARLARYIRESGHLSANIDPLNDILPVEPSLEPNYHKLTDDDLASLPASVVGGPCAEGASNCLQAIRNLLAAYRGTLAYEDDHIQVEEEIQWVRHAAESRRFFKPLDAAAHRSLLKTLTRTEVFEQYLQKNFVGKKRFSLEGNDSLIAMLELIVNEASQNKTREIVMAMAHRGRLNVLAHVLNKPYELMLQGFIDKKGIVAIESDAEAPEESDVFTGDVKYHLGYIRSVSTDGHEMPVTLAPNPSHLEFVNPVTMGRARAAQEDRSSAGKPKRDRLASLNIAIHGDAAFPGQGVVAETLNLSCLVGYRVGGAIHIILNNQVGFTTDPIDSRSTRYCSDLARGFEIPIVHVNADDPEACLAAARMAFAYREQFQKDFLIDLVGYRRHGHNEGDEPAYTQPVMYQKIRSHPTVRQIWANKLISEGILTTSEVEAMERDALTEIDAARSRAAEQSQIQPEGEVGEIDLTSFEVDTGISEARLRSLNESLLLRNAGFKPDPKLERILQRRRAALDEGSIDWGHAESLAFASILEDGTPIRLSGQDSERGTFGHRHIVLHDGETNKQVCTLQSLPQAKASFAVYNSPLSENAVLGFEYGYSVHASDTLVLWEAQFGDFGNGAQVIIDQFIASGNAKWQQTPSLVLLLPHGYEGMGPEHSSARLERFLQLCANNNMRVVNCSNSAQYFHVLRRQAALLKIDPRPLVILTPKSLLREPRASATLSDLTDGRFESVIDDIRFADEREKVTRLVFCSGKVYVDLTKAPQWTAQQSAAVIRIEQLYPFPSSRLLEIMSKYRNVKEAVWLQEEPQNMGAWTFMLQRLNPLLPPGVPLTYAGRPASASTAVGYESMHLQEQARLISAAVEDLISVESSLRESLHAR